MEKKIDLLKVFLIDSDTKESCHSQYVEFQEAAVVSLQRGGAMLKFIATFHPEIETGWSYVPRKNEANAP